MRFLRKILFILSALTSPSFVCFSTAIILMGSQLVMSASEASAAAEESPHISFENNEDCSAKKISSFEDALLGAHTVFSDIHFALIVQWNIPSICEPASFVSAPHPRPPRA